MFDPSTLQGRYYVLVGDSEVSDALDWEGSLKTEEQQNAYVRALLAGAPIDETPELGQFIDATYQEIQEGYQNEGDKYTLEFLGEAAVKPEVINEMVAGGNERALEFFGLNELSPEEMDAWDARDLDDLPLVKDLDDVFGADGPFNGWNLRVVVPDSKEIVGDMDEEELRELLKRGVEMGEEELARKAAKEWEESFVAEIDGLSDYVEELLSDK